jgi:hypothetical protein
MKRKIVSLAVLLAALSFFAAPSATALSTTELLAIKKAVVEVPAAEVAARAAQIVKQASKADRKDVALATIREIVSSRPATIVQVVAAIAKTAPELSVAVAGEAAKLATDQSAEIAKAAATGAPSQADQIAAAVAKVAPGSAVKVTQAVASLVPEQASAISEAVVASVPTAQSQIANDPVIRGMRARSASSPAGGGIIVARPGTIRGTPAPLTPPNAVGTPTPGSDTDRAYARP